MGRRTFNIGEIARILGVPASTLRFWEKKSLFRIGKGDNQYRQYTTTDLIRIADTVFYRNMGIPISQINDFLTVPLEDHGAFLETMQVQLNEKIMQYRQMEERLRRQRTHYACLKQLLEHPYTMEEVPFQSISPWEFWERSGEFAQGGSTSPEHFEKYRVPARLCRVGWQKENADAGYRPAAHRSVYGSS